MTAYTEKCSRSMTLESAGAIQYLLCLFRNWVENQQLRVRLSRERRQLAAMSGHELKDIGLTREQADTEAARRDVPLARMSVLLRGRG